MQEANNKKVKIKCLDSSDYYCLKPYNESY